MRRLLFLLTVCTASAQTLPSWITAAYEDVSIQQSGGLLTGWQDITGNGHHIVSVPAAAVVVNKGGETWLDFSSSKYCVLPNTLQLSTQAGTVFVVGYNTATTGSRTAVSMGDGSGGAGYGQVSDVMPSGLLNHTPNSTAPQANKIWSGFGWQMVGVVTTASERRVWVETENYALAASSAATNTGGVIGRWMGNNSNYWNSGIKAVYIAAISADAAQIAELRAYVQQRCRVGASTATAVVAVDGDSNTAGAGSDPTMPWPLWMGSAATAGQANMRPKFRNFGTGGHTTAQMLSGIADPLNWLGDQTAFSRKIYVVMGGTNDVGSVALETIQSNLTAMVAAAHAEGVEAAVVTVLPDAGDPTNAVRNALNAWIKAGSSGADHIVDLTAIAELTDADNGTYFHTDGVHLTAAGSKLIGDAVQAELFPPLLLAAPHRALLVAGRSDP